MPRFAIGRGGLKFAYGCCEGFNKRGEPCKLPKAAPDKRFCAMHLPKELEVLA